MSALGQKRTSEYVRAMYALPPKADIRHGNGDVRYVPKAGVSRCSKNPLSKAAYSITSSASKSTLSEIFMSSAFAVLRERT